MQKIKDFVVSLDFAVIVFVLIGLRITVAGASIGDALAIISLVGLKAFNNWLASQKKEDINATVSKELEDIKTTVSGLMVKQAIRPSATQAENPIIKKFF